MNISIKGIIKNVMKDIFLNLMLNIMKNYMNFQTIYHSYQKKTKFEKTIKPVASLHDKTEYGIHIRNSKQGLNHGLPFKKFIQ